MRFFFAFLCLLTASQTYGATIDVSLNSRLRGEWLKNGHRPGTPAYDNIYTTKTLLQASVQGSRWYAVGELQDSRAWGYQPSSPVGSGFINTLEPLQAKIGWQGKLTDAHHLNISVGRTTLLWQNGRLLGRQGYRTTIESFTGLSATLSHTNDWRVTAVGMVYNPIQPANTDPEAQRSREHQYDRPDTRTRLAGINAEHIALGEGAELALYAIALDESDSDWRATFNRRLLTAGMHVTGTKGDWHWLTETALQVGTRQGSRVSGDIDDRELDVMAGFVHLEASRQLSRQWEVVLLGNYASGDATPQTGKATTFDTLYTSARKGDFNLTGMWGIHANSNILSPGVRLHWHGNPDWRITMRYRPAWQHAVDSTGGGIEFKGHDAEAEIAFQPAGSTLSWAAGVGYFHPAGTLSQSLAQEPGNSLYAFLEMSINLNWRNH